MEKYDINLGYYYMKYRLEKLYLDDEYKDSMKFEVKKVENNKDTSSFKNFQKIYFSVNYPGLLIGTGTSIEYTQIDKKSKIKLSDNFKIGLSFDYTTGLPYIPGSSIKGVLRDFFPRNYYSEEEKTKETMEKVNKENSAKTEIINYLLKKDYSCEQLKSIMFAIFEGMKTIKENVKDEEKYLPVYKRDKFIEGRIIIEKGEKLEILGKDYITPHKEILKDPTPLEILKIVPGTKFEFLFELYDTEIDGIKITKEGKLQLFREILYLTGIGAKTNVGYGHFDEEKSLSIVKEQEKLKKQKEEQEKKKLEEEKKMKIEKLKENMSEYDKFIFEFENEWTDEDKKQKVRELKNFEGEEKKKIAKIFLEFLKKDSKPSKKTKTKIKELEEILKN